MIKNFRQHTSDLLSFNAIVMILFTQRCYESCEMLLLIWRLPGNYWVGSGHCISPHWLLDLDSSCAELWESSLCSLTGCYWASPCGLRLHQVKDLTERSLECRSTAEELLVFVFLEMFLLFVFVFKAYCCWVQDSRWAVFLSFEMLFYCPLACFQEACHHLVCALGMSFFFFF